jgi:alkylation response protein AidB-like acyl-CoA dehydrogenase
LSHADSTAEMILRFGTDEQKVKYLTPLCTGKAISSGAFTEPDHGSDIRTVSTTAVRDGDDYVINGSKMFISNGPIADFIIVLCQTNLTIEPSYRGQSVIIVEKGSPGYTVADVGEKMGNKMTPTGELSFTDLKVPAANLIGKEGQGFYQALRILEEIRVEISAQALGIAQGAFDRAFAYVKQRKQFGRKLIDFQATQHTLSELMTKIETARLMVYKAAWAIDQEQIDPMLTSMAKMHAARVAVEVADEAIQLFGGYGYMLEYEVERFYRDARLMGIFGGTREVQKNTIARELMK